jgi:solute carrier family 25 protein 39/40
MSSSSPSPGSLLPRIVSGSIGSMAVAIAVTPLEVVKVRQQTYYSPLPCAECGATTIHNGLMECVFPMESTVLRPRGFTMISPVGSGGTISTLVSIFRNEGYGGLYAGLRPTLVMSVPNTVLYFAAYDELSLRLRHNHHHQAAYIPLLAGSTARLLATLATAPLELVRTRQAGLPRGTSGVSGMADEFFTLIKSNGVISLYSGLAPTLWRDVPFSAIYWLFLERFRDAMSSPSESTRFLGKWGGYHHVVEMGIDRIPPVVEAAQAFVAGAAAGSIAAAFTT